MLSWDPPAEIITSQQFFMGSITLSPVDLVRVANGSLLRKQDASGEVAPVGSDPLTECECGDCFTCCDRARRRSDRFDAERDIAWANDLRALYEECA